MKLVTFTTGDAPRLGAVRGDQVIDLAAASGGKLLIQYQQSMKAGSFVLADEVSLLSLLDDRLYDSIAEAAKANSPWSLAPQSRPRYILKDCQLKDDSGTYAQPEAIRQSVKRLLADGKIVEVKGKPRNNGLYPVEKS